MFVLHVHAFLLKFQLILVERTDGEMILAQGQEGVHLLSHSALFLVPPVFRPKPHSKPAICDDQVAPAPSRCQDNSARYVPGILFW